MYHETKLTEIWSILVKLNVKRLYKYYIHCAELSRQISNGSCFCQSVIMEVLCSDTTAFARGVFAHSGYRCCRIYITM